MSDLTNEMKKELKDKSKMAVNGFVIATTGGLGFIAFNRAKARVAEGYEVAKTKIEAKREANDDSEALAAE